MVIAVIVGYHAVKLTRKIAAAFRSRDERPALIQQAGNLACSNEDVIGDAG